ATAGPRSSTWPSGPRRTTGRSRSPRTSPRPTYVRNTSGASPVPATGANPRPRPGPEDPGQRPRYWLVSMPTAQKDRFGVTEIDSDADRAADHIGSARVRQDLDQSRKVTLNMGGHVVGRLRTLLERGHVV